MMGNAYPAIAEKADKLFYKLGVKIIARVYQVFNAVCLGVEFVAYAYIEQPAGFTAHLLHFKRLAVYSCCGLFA